MSGRPLRFLGTILLLWVMMRVVAWWPNAPAPHPILADMTDPPPVATSFRRSRRVAVDRPITAPRSAARNRERTFHPADLPPARAISNIGAPLGTRATPPAEWSPIPITGGETSIVSTAAFPGVPPSTRSTDRWAIGIWGIARDGRSDLLATGQLGASQFGARATYTVDAPHRIALAARISAPLRGRGREAAIGIDWQPVPAPVHLIAERRFPLDGGASRPAAFVTAGLDRAAFGSQVRVEGYGQAGGVLRRGLFADAAVRVTTPVARLHLGIGTWAGAQRGASRFDIGPTVALVLPVADRGVRLTLDWRHRIAGDARPGSGPALSIGGDF